MTKQVVDVLFPAVRSRIFQLLFRHDEPRLYVRELANITGLALRTVQDELRKLEAVGLVSSAVAGRRRYYRATRTHRLHGAIKAIVAANRRLPGTKTTLLVRPSQRKQFRRRSGASPQGDAADQLAALRRAQKALNALSRQL